MKKPERPRRSLRKIDEYVINYACEDACVKIENVKSVKKCSPGAGGGGGGGCLQVPTEAPCMYRVILPIRWGEGRGGDIYC